MRFGSSVNGIGYRSGIAFDGVKRSDFDLAVVSPSLFDAAVKAGVGTRSGGSRTEPIGPDADVAESLKLREMLRSLRKINDRKVSIMIYRDWNFLATRGPYRILP